ncbi:MAG: AbrB/MazE/SpoVT family DNA-binding domain-containing protein [Acidilobaceae archaeon]
MAEVGIRKVQRLGASSLIITLPHSWVKRVNLKPGDSVMVVDEGLSLRLAPISRTSKSRTAKVDLRSVRDSMVLNLLIPCLYILGYDEVDIKLSERDTYPLSRIRSATLRLPGLEVVDLGGDGITAKVLLDPGKVDLRTSIRGMTILTSNIVRAIARAVGGELTGDAEAEIRSLSEELYRLRSIVERQLHVYPYAPYKDEGLNPILALTALTLLGLMDALLLDTVAIVKGGFRPSRELSGILSRLGDLIPLIGSAIASPSVRRAVEVLMVLQKVQEDTVNLVRSKALEDLQYIIATRVVDLVKILQIICYAVTCVGLFREGEGV